MKEETSIDIKVSGQNPMAECKEKIWLFDLGDGRKQSGKLIDVRGNHLLFEKRNGMRILVRQDAIKSAFEVDPRRQ
jgi:hypothetical protein